MSIVTFFQARRVCKGMCAKVAAKRGAVGPLLWGLARGPEGCDFINPQRSFSTLGFVA